MTESPFGELAPGHGPMRNTLFSLISRVLSAVFTIALTLFLVRALGPTKYGVLALAVSVGSVIMLVSDFGISASAARFVAENPRDRMHAAAILWTALRLKLLASTAATVALVTLAPVIADAYGIPALTLPLQLIAIAVAAQGLGGLFLYWFTALRRSSINIQYGVVESSLETTASICLVLLGGGAAGAVAGRAVGFTAAGILAATLAVRLVGWPAMRDARGRGFPVRRIVRYGAALVVIDGVYALFDRADVLIIGAVIGSAAAGTFEAAFRILSFLAYPGLAVASGFSPRLAQGQRSGADSALFIGALRYTILLYLLLAAPALVWAEPITQLVLGDAYSSSAEVLRALAPTVVLAGVSPVLATGANFLGEARRRVPLSIGALLINVVIDLILVPRIGIIAGAIGTGVAFALYVAGHVQICQRALGVSFSRLGRTSARGIIAWAVAALVLLAFGTGQLSAFAWIVGALTATFAYISALILLRELNPDEVRAAIRLLRRPFRRERVSDAPGPS
ncbi:MAG: oligosaccharide flippase family protein [Actinomycetota bacterium]